MLTKRIVGFALLAVLASNSGISNAHACGAEAYFGPEDTDNKNPLKLPHPDFQKTRQLAARGDAAEERNLGAYYDSGYLVSPCREKAAGWYAKAAKHGDAVAIAWMQRHSALQDVRNRLECFGDNCLVSSRDGFQKTVLQRGPGGNYTAVVSINGKTVRGLVDTGATFVSMSARTANELGVSYRTGKQVQMITANGTTVDRAVMLSSVTVGNITLDQVEAVVGEADHPLLIGMSFLGRLTINTDGNGMTLVKP
ncbi:MAG: TIGR02281 family clan AA aspartic protease [Burkholderiales bacterium]